MVTVLFLLQRNPMINENIVVPRLVLGLNTKAALIDVNRGLTTSNLSVSDCTMIIEVDLSKSWSTTFNQRATLKRVGKATTEVAESADAN